MLLSFLKKNEITKLKLLSILFVNEKISGRELEELLQTPPTTTSRMITTLKEDLLTVFDNHIEINEKNQYFYLAKISDISRTEAANKLYYHYLVESLDYQIFKHVIFTNNIHILTLCSDINISQSYCYSKIKKINSYLKTFQLKIVSEAFNISIQGPETHIIFFIFLIHDMIHNMENQPWDNHEKKIALTKDNVTYEQVNRIPVTHLDTFSSFMETYEQRKTYLDTIQINRDDIQAIYQLVIAENDFFANNYDSATTNDDAVLYYNLFMRSIIPNIDSYEQRVAIGKNFVGLTNNVIVDNAVATVNKIVDTIFSEVISHEDEHYYEMIYLVSLYTSYIDILGIDFKSRVKQPIKEHILDFVQHQPAPLEIEITKLVTQSSQVYPNWKRKTQQDYIKIISKVLYSMVYSYQQPTYNIMIDTFCFLLGEYSIQKQIMSYFSTNHINFVEDYSQVDLLITDRSVSYGNQTPVFFLYDIHCTTSWENLLTTIVRQTHRKNLNELSDSAKLFNLT
ncbi:helix-turn-helix domain-containing protein [Vagococcus sp. BWB3-3]|uniref:Helix-turn-helix domain-containing protein n=1 Tax=Vagococcus allomyrinae TaxID=2794353 RepID=A0A940P6K5_9ENTE|nr:helix-turn-helix domain-containing protein [Vagococcus allomyrinae]MBP1039414.1 helix-turn-helix domain-containing protein [Vagococcus allomyrinae]